MADPFQMRNTVEMIKMALEKKLFANPLHTDLEGEDIRLLASIFAGLSLVHMLEVENLLMEDLQSFLNNIGDMQEFDLVHAKTAVEEVLKKYTVN